MWCGLKKRSMDDVADVPAPMLRRSSAMRSVQLSEGSEKLAKELRLTKDATHIYYFETSQDGRKTHYMVNEGNFTDVRAVRDERKLLGFLRFL